MAAEFLSATILLILVIDPFGNVPLVAAALAATPAERRARVVLRECLIAYAVLLAFMFGGHAFLTLMHVSETALSIAGGVILFLIALRMVFSHPEEVFGDAPGFDPFIVPLAIPAIAGPSALATVMLMASREPEHLGAWAARLWRSKCC
jgi:small neutral amino acid transporter SnatA (MarC family)